MRYREERPPSPFTLSFTLTLPLTSTFHDHLLLPLAAAAHLGNLQPTPPPHRRSPPIHSWLFWFNRPADGAGGSWGDQKINRGVYDNGMGLVVVPCVQRMLAVVQDGAKGEPPHDGGTSPFLQWSRNRRSLTFSCRLSERVPKGPPVRTRGLLGQWRSLC